jgi:hypothetical protein
MERKDRRFADRISEFCKLKLGPLLGPETPSFQAFLIGLHDRGELPPTRGRGIDWRSIAGRSGVRLHLVLASRDQIRPILDALTRELGLQEAGALAPSRVGSRLQRTGKRSPTSAKAAVRLEPPPKLPLKLHGTDNPRLKTPLGCRNAEQGTISSSLPSIVNTFPEALTALMDRAGETYWDLHRAVVRLDESFDPKAIRAWARGEKAPSTVASLEIVRRIERHYRLPEGELVSRLPHRARAAKGHVLEGVSASERRRLAWHLPDNFNVLPREQQEQIVEWVRRVIISGSTDYRRFQAAATKHRYAIRFPGVAYGRSEPSVGEEAAATEEDASISTDPDLQSGVVDAPPQLTMEMASLVRFKTSTLTAFGLRRNGVWGEETTSQKIEHLGLMLGALAASPKAAVRGYGVPLQHLTLGLLVFPGVWDWYVQWRERRRGFYTAWEVDMLRIALALTRQETGWLRQHGQLIHRVRPIPGLITPEEIERAKADWDGACDNFFKHAPSRVKEIQRVARVHRDPFEPIMPVLEAPSPVGEYRKITEEILRRMPDPMRYPRAAAEAVRSFLMLRLGLHLGLRQKNLRQLMVCPRGQTPRTERQLEDLKRGELRWSDRDDGWEVLIPSVAFKNAHSSYFGSKPFRLILPNLGGLYEHIDAYIRRDRHLLLAGAPDPGTFFIKTVKQSSTDPAYDQTTFYEAWRLTIQRYGIYNPFTGRGAIRGLLPHGPHNVRDVLATHILKQTGSYEQASYAIQDTPEMVQNHYGRFLPQDKAALAAKILNQVWEAA